MTKTTKKKTVNVLAQLEQQEAMERGAAQGRYWQAVVRLTEGEVTSLSPEEATELRDDLRVLGRAMEDLQRDINKLREVRRLAEESDLVDRAQERRNEAEERADKAAAREQKAQAALAQAAKEASNARLIFYGAGDGVAAAQRQEQLRAKRFKEGRAELLGRGAPVSALPPLPDRTPPEPKIKHRVLQRTLVDNAIRVPGDVVLLHERTSNHVVRPMGADEPDQVRPTWRVKALRGYRDDDGSHMPGDVWITETDPSGNPFVAVVPDDVPVGLASGESLRVMRD